MWVMCWFSIVRKLQVLNVIWFILFKSSYYLKGHGSPEGLDRVQVGCLTATHQPKYFRDEPQWARFWTLPPFWLDLFGRGVCKHWYLEGRIPISEELNARSVVLSVNWTLKLSLDRVDDKLKDVWGLLTGWSNIFPSTSSSLKLWLLASCWLFSCK